MSDTDPSSPWPHPDDARPRPARTAAEAEDISALARHGDPSQAKKSAVQTGAEEGAEQARRGVRWVRPSELLDQLTARAAGRGIDFHAELARRARRLPGETYRATRGSIRQMSERARRLPPVTAFGRSAQGPQGATRSGIGLR